MHIEVDRCDQIALALDAGADCILLDNFSRNELWQALDLIDNRAYTEASGGIQREDLDTLKQLGLDFISTGALRFTRVNGLIWGSTAYKQHTMSSPAYIATSDSS